MQNGELAGGNDERVTHRIGRVLRIAELEPAIGVEQRSVPVVRCPQRGLVTRCDRGGYLGIPHSFPPLPHLLTVSPHGVFGQTPASVSAKWRGAPRGGPA